MKNQVWSLLSTVVGTENSYFHKYKNEIPQYLFKLIPVRGCKYFTESMHAKCSFLKNKTCLFKNIFLLVSHTQQNILDLNIWNSSSLIFLETVSLNLSHYLLIVFFSHNHKAIKFITRLRLVLSYLREHLFKHNFQDLVNPIWMLRVGC